MKIEPNKDIGMSAKTLLVNKGNIEFPDGHKISPDDLKTSGNYFEELCNSIDPNVTYINILIPDHADDEVFFKVQDAGFKIGIHVQSVANRPDSIWRIWENEKNISNQDQLE